MIKPIRATLPFSIIPPRTEIKEIYIPKINFYSESDEIKTTISKLESLSPQLQTHNIESNEKKGFKQINTVADPFMEFVTNWDSTRIISGRGGQNSYKVKDLKRLCSLCDIPITSKMNKNQLVDAIHQWMAENQTQINHARSIVDQS